MCLRTHAQRNINHITIQILKHLKHKFTNIKISKCLTKKSLKSNSKQKKNFHLLRTKVPCKNLANYNTTRKQICTQHKKNKFSIFARLSGLLCSHQMTTTCCPGSSKSFWWGSAPDITDWTVICTASWSWHPHQPAPVVKRSKPHSTFHKDTPFTKLQEKMCGPSALPWRLKSTAANRSWRRRHHSSPEQPWLCRLRTPRRRSPLHNQSSWTHGLLHTNVQLNDCTSYIFTIAM